MSAVALALALLASPALADDGPDRLLPGEPVPVLKDVTWLQGEAVTAWQPGHVYILDFWATWCGPCKKAIPHMDQISDTRGAQNVHVIGVAIWPRPNMVPTPDFVREKGDAMSYRICEDVDGRTAAAFMEPTGSNGIPTCMVVGKTGQLEWVGHPMAGMDEVLDQVLAGTWDSAAFGEEMRARLEREAKADAIQQELGQATEARDWAGVARLANQLYELDAEQFGGAALMSYDALLRARQAEQAATYGRKLVESFKDVPQALNALAWTIVDPQQSRETPDLELALSAAEKANTLTQAGDFSVLDTLARVVFLKGDAARARELQQKAIDLAPAEAKAELEGRLKEYETTGTH